MNPKVVVGATIGGAAIGAVALPAVASALLRLLGFKANGVAGGSRAAAWQAHVGNVRTGGLFATFQRAGASGIGISIAVVGGVVGALFGKTITKILHQMYYG